MMKCKFSDLVNIEGLEKLMTSFNKATGIACSIIDSYGTILLNIEWQDICTKFHRAHPETEHRCKKSDAYISPSREENFVIYKCANGLINAAAPIVIGGEHLATVFVGQFLFEPPDVEYFKNQALKYGFNVNEYLEALNKVPVFSKEEIYNVITYYTELAKFLGEVGFNNLKQLELMQEELFKASKLESIGLLAGGTAHDFNNLLAVVMGNISISLKELNQEDKVFKRLKKAEKAIQQATDLTRQLQTFAKGGVPVKKTSSIEELIREITSFALCGSNVHCIFSFPEDLSYVDINEGQISQVVHNIIINAVQAMPEGGTISISAENVDFGEKKKNFACPMEKGPYVKLMIQDNGTGISEKNIRKVFDPFFSTKAEGTGMGLATSYSIVKRHGGYIDVNSQTGLGTTFYIYLPASSEEAIVTKKEDRIIVRGIGRILVMDDDESVRNIAGEMATSLGYEVKFAHNGQEAVLMYKIALENNDAYDAVILDLTVPGGMGGKETAKEILAIDKNANLIVSSGYSKDPVLADYEKYGFKAIIAKPYKIEELSKVLSEVKNKE